MAQDRIIVPTYLALASPDGALGGDELRALETWFSSPFWGFEVDRGRKVVITRGEGSWMEPSVPVRVPTGGAGHRPPDQGPGAECDEVFRSSGHALLDTVRDQPRGTFVLRTDGQALRADSLRGVLTTLLGLRLRYWFGPDLVEALQPLEDRRGSRRRMVTISGTLPPADVLLPTEAGEALRARLVLAGDDLVVPALAFAPVLGHLVGTPRVIRAAEIPLASWSESPGAPSVLEPRPCLTRLRRRGALLLAVRPVVLLAIRLAIVIPARPRRGRMRLLARISDGSLRVHHSRTLRASSATDGARDA